ncbi:malate synthase G [Brucella suis 63/252]|nr:malate synthase G [Brucella suis 63/252]
MGSAEKRNYVEIEGLAVAPELVEFLAKEAAPCSPSVTSFRPGSTPGTRKTATRATARPITSSF